MNAPGERPNVIWVFGDQHRAASVGYAGDPNVVTPNIDRLATTGTVFRNAVAGSPLCCPYRGALLTSRYPHQSVPGHEHALPDGMPTIAKPFNDAGYHTAYIGKWHVDGFHERNGRAALHHVPASRRGGFRQWLGYENNNAQWDCWVHGHDDAGREIPHYRLPEFETDALTTLALEYLDQRALDRAPFFCVLSVQPPHDPYQAPERWMARHSPSRVTLRPNVPDVPWVVDRARRELAGYHAMIENLDWNVGRILQHLDQLGLADNTHVVFFSDHGDMHGSHGQFLKTNPYEESIRVPFVIGCARSSHYNLRYGPSDAPMNHVDVGPTSLGLCGIDVPSWMQGTNYAAHRLSAVEKSAEPDSAYLQLVVPTGHGDSTDRPWRGIVTRDGWKYVCLEGQPWLMFDLKSDPYEQANLALNRRFGQQRQRLQARLAQWIEQTGDRFDLPSI